MSQLNPVAKRLHLPCLTRQSEWKRHQALTARRQSRKSASANVNLQRRMQQFWRRESSISLVSQHEKVSLGYILGNMLIPFPVLANGQPGHGLAPPRARRIVMARPNLDILRQT